MSNGNQRDQPVEAGDLFFFYRPRVNESRVQGQSDVQQLYMVLRSADQSKFRLAVLGGKELPDPHKHGRPFWGFVDQIAEEAGPIRKTLQGDTYETQTRGERDLPGARPAGEGVYRIVRHHGHTHLAYALELPRRSGSVQEQLDVAPEASYVISVKNPQRGDPQTTGLEREQQADYPEKLQDKFDGEKFADADPPDLLNYQGAEFLLISASGDVSQELGIELEPEAETKHSAELFKQLKMKRDQATRQPLLEGDWK